MATEIENQQENLELKIKKKKKKQSIASEEKEETDNGLSEIKNGDSEHVENESEVQSPTDGKKKKKKKKKKESVGEEVAEEQAEDVEQESAEVEDTATTEDGEGKKKKKKKNKNKQSLSTESETAEEEVATPSDEPQEEMESEEEKPAVKQGKKRPAEDSHAVYVGNMSFGTDEDQLKEFFTSNGHHPTSIVIISWQSGLSSGFGIVNFASKEAADSAIELDGGNLDGRAVRINVYTGKLQKTSGGGFQKGRSPGGSGGFDSEETDTLFALGLSFNSSEDDLYEAFQGCESVDLFKDRETGKSKGMAKVKYASVEEAKSAMAEMNNQEIDGRTVKLRFFTQNGGGGRGGRGGFRGGRGGRGGGGFRGGRGGDRGRGFGRGRGRGRGGGTPFKGTGQKITFDD